MKEKKDLVNKNFNADKQQIWSELSNKCKGGRWQYSTDVKMLFFLALSIFVIIIMIILVYNRDEMDDVTRKIKTIHDSNTNRVDQVDSN